MIDTKYTYPALEERLEAAIKAEHMGLVISASASQSAKTAGFDFPDNKVFGLTLSQLRFCELQKLEEGRL